MRKVMKSAIIALAILLGAHDIELGGRQVNLGFFSLTSDAQAR
jgi:hypothetical protein